MVAITPHNEGRRFIYDAIMEGYIVLTPSIGKSVQTRMLKIKSFEIVHDVTGTDTATVSLGDVVSESWSTNLHESFLDEDHGVLLTLSDDSQVRIITSGFAQFAERWREDNT